MTAPAYIPGRAYTIAEWAQFERDGVITRAEQIAATANHDPEQEARNERARRNLLDRSLRDARPTPPVAGDTTPSGDNAVAHTPVAPVDPPAAMNAEAADTTPVAPSTDTTAGTNLGAGDTVDEVMM
eukprot:1859297-Amphidinium_carterae.1